MHSMSSNGSDNDGSDGNGSWVYPVLLAVFIAFFVILTWGLFHA